MHQKQCNRYMCPTVAKKRDPCQHPPGHARALQSSPALLLSVSGQAPIVGGGPEAIGPSPKDRDRKAHPPATGIELATSRDQPSLPGTPNVRVVPAGSQELSPAGVVA